MLPAGWTVSMPVNDPAVLDTWIPLDVAVTANEPWLPSNRPWSPARVPVDVVPVTTVAVLLGAVGVSVRVHVSPTGGFVGRSNCSVVHGTRLPPLAGVPVIVAVPAGSLPVIESE